MTEILTFLHWKNVKILVIIYMYKGDVDKMTLQEFCQKYGYAESTVSKTFPQVKMNIFKKYGIEIVKVGKGKKANYIEKEKPEERQLEDLKEFLEKNPAIREYFEGIEG